MPNYRTGLYASGINNHHYAHHESMVADAYQYVLKKNSNKSDKQKRGAESMVSYRMRGNTWTYCTTTVSDGKKTKHEVGGFATKTEAETAYLNKVKQTQSKSA